jgi:hypothetical protein
MKLICLAASPQIHARWIERTENTKGRSLGERPAFLMSPPGCGVSKPWGVWEGASMSGLGGRRRAFWILWLERWVEALPLDRSSKTFSDAI